MSRPFTDALSKMPPGTFTKSEVAALRVLSQREQPERGCWPSERKIAAEIQAGVLTVRRALRGLVARGFVLRRGPCVPRQRLHTDCRHVRGGTHYALNYMLVAELLPPGEVRLRREVLALSQRQPAADLRELAEGATICAENRTKFAAERAELRRKRGEAGRTGNAARWGSREGSFCDPERDHFAIGERDHFDPRSISKKKNSQVESEDQPSLRSAGTASASPRLSIEGPVASIHPLPSEPSSTVGEVRYSAPAPLDFADIFAGLADRIGPKRVGRQQLTPEEQRRDEQLQREMQANRKAYRAELRRIAR